MYKENDGNADKILPLLNPGSAVSEIWSYRYGVFVGLLTCAGFVVEAIEKTGQAKEIFKFGFFAMCVTPFLVRAFTVLGGDISRRLHINNHFVGSVILVGILLAFVLSRILLLRFMFIILGLVTITTIVSLAKKVYSVTIRSITTMFKNPQPVVLFED